MGASAKWLGADQLPPARAQYDVEEESRVWLRGMLDVRVVRGGNEPSWTNGGPGKTRYGGDTSSERVTRLTLSQLAIEFGATLPWNVRAQAQLNLQRDLSDNDEPPLPSSQLDVAKCNFKFANRHSDR